LTAWDIRRDRFSGFVNGLPKVGWNTFDYTRRDLHYPGCLQLFKLDSTNTAFMEKIGAISAEIGPNTFRLSIKSGFSPGIPSWL